MTEFCFGDPAFAVVIAFAYLVAFVVFDRTVSAVVIIYLISRFSVAYRSSASTRSVNVL